MCVCVPVHVCVRVCLCVCMCVCVCLCVLFLALLLGWTDRLLILFAQLHLQQVGRVKTRGTGYCPNLTYTCVCLCVCVCVCVEIYVSFCKAIIRIDMVCNLYRLGEVRFLAVTLNWIRI